MFDASTVQFCPNYIRGASGTTIGDLYYHGMFQVFRQMNVTFRSTKKVKSILNEHLENNIISKRKTEHMVSHIVDYVNLSFVNNRATHMIGGIIEDITIDGVGYMVPIFGVSKNSSLSKHKDEYRYGVVIYDDMIPGYIPDEIIMNSFLVQSTLYALSKYYIHIDYIEHISNLTRDSTRPELKKTILTGVEYNYGLLRSYSLIHKKNIPNIFHCDKCINKLKCWG